MTPPNTHIPLSIADLGSEEQRLVLEVLASGRLSTGPMLLRFEREFAERFGARFAVGVSSGTAALHLGMIAAGVGEGDLVMTSPFSFIASANVILYERGIPLFIDIDPATMAIDPAKSLQAMEDLAHRRPGWQHLLPRNANLSAAELRAVLPVHVFGRPAELAQLVPAARERGVAMIEDACEAIGASLEGTCTGRFGDASAFGFFPNKQITTGEGGMLLTDREDWAKVFRSLRNQGRGDDEFAFRHERLGFNYRLDELSAALGVAQFRRLDELLARREAVAKRYADLFTEVDGVTPVVVPREGMTLSWFLYPVRLAHDLDRDAIIAALEERGITSRAYFWPIHLQPLYRDRFAFRPGDFPHAEEAGRTLLSLPIFPGLTDEQVGMVVQIVSEEIRRARATRRMAAHA